MLNREKLRVADLLSGSFLFAFGIFLLISAVRMPMGGTYGGVKNEWYASPAAMPIFIGSLLMLASCGVVIRAVRFQPPEIRATIKGWIVSPVHDAAVQRSLLIIVLLAMYVVLLNLQWFTGFSSLFEILGCGRIVVFAFLTEGNGANYFISSFLYLSSFILLFFQPEAGRGVRIAIAGVVGILIPFIFGYLFNGPLMVPLP